MAEDFKPSNWWNNSKNSFFDGASQSINSTSAPSLSCSATISESFSWSPATEIPASKPRLRDNKIEGFSSLSTDWNQTLIRSSGKGESSFRARLEEDLSTRQEIGESSTTIPFEDMNNFSASSASSSYVNSSSMFQGLAEQDKGLQQPFLDNQQMMAFHGFSNETMEPSWNKPPHLFKDFPHKQQYDITDLQFTNNASFWNASAGFYSSALPYSGIQIFESKPRYSMTAKSSEEIPETKTSNEAELKKPRIEKPSPFPEAFKPNKNAPGHLLLGTAQNRMTRLHLIRLWTVKKEKIGDRITALQQLVSPFGKTATASVLHDTIEYIKFLHDQVSVLCTPYLRNLRPTQQEKKSEKSMEGEESTQDLRSRGLCLVPITSTFAMASDGSDHF